MDSSGGHRSDRRVRRRESRRVEQHLHERQARQCGGGDVELVQCRKPGDTPTGAVDDRHQVGAHTNTPDNPRLVSGRVEASVAVVSAPSRPVELVGKQTPFQGADDIDTAAGITARVQGESCRIPKCGWRLRSQRTFRRHQSRDPIWQECE